MGWTMLYVKATAAGGESYGQFVLASDDLKGDPEALKALSERMSHFISEMYNGGEPVTIDRITEVGLPEELRD